MIDGWIEVALALPFGFPLVEGVAYCSVVAVQPVSAASIETKLRRHQHHDLIVTIP